MYIVIILRILDADTTLKHLHTFSMLIQKMLARIEIDFHAHRIIIYSMVNYHCLYTLLSRISQLYRCQICEFYCILFPLQK